MRRGFANRVDATAKSLIEFARALGWIYLPVNGTIDGVLIRGERILLIDWKSKGGRFTERQQRLIQQGVPVHFISTQADLEYLLMPNRRQGLIASALAREGPRMSTKVTDARKQHALWRKRAHFLAELHGIDEIAVDSHCPNATHGLLCTCGNCDVCWHAKHSAVHGPAFAGAAGDVPWGHVFIPAPEKL